MKPDRMLIFDLKGTWAHFRKVYTTSSSLTYAFPPRTTVTGLVAGILGRPRNSYYEEFSIERCRVALSIRIPSRRIIQTVNYIRTKSPSEFIGSGGPTQIPLEFLVPAQEEQNLCFRVYFWHENPDLMGELQSLLSQGKSVFPPYLGITECPGTATLVDAVSVELHPEGTNSPKPIATVLPVDQVQPDALHLEDGIQIMKEDRVPLEFNAERYLRRIKDFLHERNCRPIRLSPSGAVFHAIYNDDGETKDEWGVFME